MSSAFALTIRTSDRELWSGNATSALLRTELGEIEILPGHAALAGTIGFSRVLVKHDDGSAQFWVQSGFVAAGQGGETVSIIGVTGGALEKLDLVSAAEYLALVLRKLASPEGISTLELKWLEDERLAVETKINQPV